MKPLQICWLFALAGFITTKAFAQQPVESFDEKDLQQLNLDSLKKYQPNTRFRFLQHCVIILS
jgi:hypothetical protein